MNRNQERKQNQLKPPSKHAFKTQAKRTSTEQAPKERANNKHTNHQTQLFAKDTFPPIPNSQLPKPKLTPQVIFLGGLTQPPTHLSWLRVRVSNSPTRVNGEENFYFKNTITSICHLSDADLALYMGIEEGYSMESLQGSFPLALDSYFGGSTQVYFEQARDTPPPGKELNWLRGSHPRRWPFGLGSPRTTLNYRFRYVRLLTRCHLLLRRLLLSGGSTC
jgi:hypothetical protein